MLRSLLLPLIGLTSLCRLTAAEPSAPAPRPLDGVAEQAKRDGWETASLSIDLIGSPRGFPGLRAWAQDYKVADDAVIAAGPGAILPDLKIHELVTNNPNFWAAHYEIVPGDPGWALLHAGLLLAGGEAQRATVIATLALQRPAIPEPLRKALLHLIQRCFEAQASAIALTKEGVTQHELGAYSAALAKYDEALKLWPDQGWTHYERGFTLRQKALQGAKDPAAFTDPPEVTRCFERARQHDPLQISAYQGKEPKVVTGLNALDKLVMPAWRKLSANASLLLNDAELQAFGEGCQAAGIQDYALVTHSIVVARQGSYGPKDAVWISESLSRMAPGDATEKALQTLDTAQLQLKVLVPIESSKPTAEPAEKKAE